MFTRVQQIVDCTFQPLFLLTVLGDTRPFAVLNLYFCPAEMVRWFWGGMRCMCEYFGWVLWGCGEGLGVRDTGGVGCCRENGKGKGREGRGGAGGGEGERTACEGWDKGAYLDQVSGKCTLTMNFGAQRSWKRSSIAS